MSTPQERFEALKQAKEVMTATDSGLQFVGSSTKTIGKVGQYAFDLTYLADYILDEEYDDDLDDAAPDAGWVDEAQLLADGWSVPDHDPTPAERASHPARGGIAFPTVPTN